MKASEAIETLIGIRRVSGYSKNREEALDMAIVALEKQEGEGGLTMAKYIGREAAVAIIEEKQKELCPLGRYSRTMGDTMTFPKTVEEFMEEYKIVDSDQVYTNGAELVPIFRMKQWFEHINATSDAVPVCRCKDCVYYNKDVQNFNGYYRCDRYALWQSVDDRAHMPLDGFCNYGERKGGNE